jgi:arylsulfatase A-like enzyme
MSPKRFIRHFLFAATATAALCRLQATAASQPNILFIMADDHAWQALSAYGDSRHLIQTPNIDRLAKEGVRFDRCMVPNSLCGPARASLITGTYSHVNGFYNNSGDSKDPHSGACFDSSQTTFPKLLQQAGYQTAMIGKWHLESDPTGFDHWEILPEQGIYYNPPMICDGTNVQHQGYVTKIVTDLSLDWLKNRDQSKPFMLLCWHKAPHRIWEPALDDLDFDHDRQYPLPDTLFDDYSGRGQAEHDQDMMIASTMRLNEDCKLTAPPDLSPAQRKIWDAYYGPRNEAFKKMNLTGKALTEWKYNRYMHDYLGCIKGLDDSVGRILKYLDDTGLATNTIVVYSSDQGVFLGEHGWFDKRWIFQESARTPLLVRWPGVTQPDAACDKIVSSLDLAETFLNAANVPIPSRMQGASLIPLLKGENPADWRKAFYYHYYEYPAWHRVPPHYGVVTDRYTLAHFYSPPGLNPSSNMPKMDYWELFDRKKNPAEMKNVFGDPTYAGVRTNLMQEVSRLRKELKEPAKDDPKAYGYPAQFPPNL